jgi:hypothetical protein
MMLRCDIEPDPADRETAAYFASALLANVPRAIVDSMIERNGLDKDLYPPLGLAKSRWLSEFVRPGICWQ